jgi:hypothetical protein
MWAAAAPLAMAGPEVGYDRAWPHRDQDKRWSELGWFGEPLSYRYDMADAHIVLGRVMRVHVPGKSRAGLGIRKT